MKERIILFLQTENKSSAQFAQEIGVQPSSISHIISGRNNPSLDFVMKMLSRYPFLSSDWLLFGKGEMTRENIEKNLFYSSISPDTGEYGKKPGKEMSVAPGATKDLFEERSGIKESNKKDIKPEFPKTKRIICFSDDNTFTEYFPGAD